MCDSNFPVGSFNHSYGMETYLRLNRVYNHTFREWLNVYLKGTIYIYRCFSYKNAL